MMELLPDLPGTITGIKCLDPYGGMIPPPQGMFDELA